MKQVNDLKFLYSDTNQKWEIVQVSDSGSTFVIMFFDKGSEGYNIRFVGKRPFEYTDPAVLWSLMRYADRFLEAEFNLEEDLS